MAQELKELRARFLSLVDTADIERMIELQRDFQKYLKTNEDSEDNKYKNTIHLLKALIKYEETYDGVEAYRLLKPMMEDFDFGRKVERLDSNYNKKLLIYSISVCGSYRQGMKIVNTLERSFIMYPTAQEVEDDFKVGTYLNFVSKLLYEKTTIPQSLEDEAKIRGLFIEYTQLSKQFCEKLGKEEWLAVLEFRNGLFFENSKLLSKGMYLTNKTAENKLYEEVYREFNKHAKIEAMEKELAKKVGIRIKKAREGMGLSVSELSKFLNISPDDLSKFEEGGRGIKLTSLMTISYLFNIHLQELVAQ